MPSLTPSSAIQFRDSCSAILSRPFWWSSEQTSRIVSPLTPGQYGQCNSKTIEVTIRVIVTIFILAIVPLSLILKLFAEITVSGVNALKRLPYTYLEGKKQHIDDKHRLSVLTWNICQLPGGLPRNFGEMDLSHRRIKGIVNKIRKANCDVVCLQEAHNVSMAYKLYDGLKENYNHFFLNIGSKGFCHNSGLFVASKYPLTNPQFVPYRFKGRQTAINKGYFAFDLIKEDRMFARIVTTHLQPGNSRKDQTIRYRELEMAHAALKEKSSDLQILCGDLNIDRSSKEKGLQLIKKNYIDAWTDQDGAFEETNFEGGRGESVDYCLLKNKPHGLTITKIIAYGASRSDADLSDHHGVIVELKVKE